MVAPKFRGNGAQNRHVICPHIVKGKMGHAVEQIAQKGTGEESHRH